MTTLQKLRNQEQTIGDRIALAATAGDVTALADLEYERHALPALLRAAEIAELRLAIIEAQAEVAETSAAERVERERMATRAAERLAFEKQYRLDERQAAQAAGRAQQARENLRMTKDRLETLVAEAAGWAEAQRAPVMRSLWHTKPR